MGDFLKNIIRFVFFILVQAFVLDKVPLLHQYIKPYIYFIFILWLPFSLSRVWLMLIAFVFGLAMDYFTGSPGLHAAPCVLIAYLRPFILNALLPQEKTEFSYVEPTVGNIGITRYFFYVVVLCFVHNAYLVFIEWMRFGDFLFFIGKVLGTTAVSILLDAVVELLFFRKARYITNAA
ncbi:MAG: rod shape-determining protein MreD [Chitinophagaceae bacterium]|jgi:rod shape-determining protein MreD|nr:rod shape-determining protein MreD [Chitinophagaceae bacterium]